jgi:RNAse (barnase) inhibitor barstar
MVIMAEIMNLTFDNGIKKIAVNDSDGNIITVLLINTADAATAKRFAELANNLEEIINAGDSDIEVYKEKYKEYEGKDFEDLPDAVKTDIIVDASKIRITVLEGMIKEIDALFGKDTIHNVFKECYELHEDFVPDEDALIDFVNTVMPVMNELFATRTESIRKKYSPNRAARRHNRNKHNKNKNQLIQEYKDTKHE